MKSSIIFSLILLGVFHSSCNEIEKPDDDVAYPAAYVINGESNSISLINIATDELVQTCKFELGTWPHHIYANQSKSELVVSMTGTDLSGGHASHGDAETSYLILLRATDLKVLDVLETDYVAHNALFMKGDQEIWLPQMATSGHIIRLNSKNLKEIGRIDVGAGPLEITKDLNQTYAFVANGEANTVSVLDAQSGNLVKTIAVGDEPVGAWPAINNKMYVDCEVSKQVFELDVATLTITDTIQLDFTPAYVAYNSLTETLWVSDSQNGGVSIYAHNGSDWIETTFLPTGANAHAVTFTGDFSKAYVTNQFSHTLSVIDVVTMTKIKDIPTGLKPNGIILVE